MMNTETFDKECDQDQVRTNLCNQNHWLRLAFMLMYALILHLAGLVMWALCALQFIFSVSTGKDNRNLRRLGASVAVFIHQALNFLSYNSEHKPFPFSHWPDSSENNDQHNNTLPADKPTP